MAIKTKTESEANDWRLTLIGTLIICIPAFRNGFPFMYVDTHAYIHSGMTVSVPFDRPIFYGLWLAISSLTLSLWLPALFQAALTSLMFLRFFKLFMEKRQLAKYFLITTATLTLFSGMALNATMLLPDAFTPIMIIAYVLFLFDSEHQRQYLGILICSAVMHNSHWLILGLLSGVLLIFYRSNNSLKLRSFLKLLGIAVLAALLLSTTNFLKFKQFTPSVATHFFLMGRLAETGVLERYLERRCDSEPDYFLCDIQDQLPMGASEYIWGEWGPLAYKGGFWEHKQAYTDLVKEVFVQPGHVVSFAYRSLGDGFHQLFLNRILLERHDVGSNTQQQLEKHFFTDATAARQSMQVYEHGLMGYMNLGYQILLVLSFCFLAFVWYQKRLSMVVVLLILSVLGNAFITSTFANVDSRLQSRLAWLIILAAFFAWQQSKAREDAQISSEEV